MNVPVLKAKSRGKGMDEEEWLRCFDPSAMLRFVQRLGSPRKLRLFACACVREIGPFVRETSCRVLVPLAEDWVDGKVSQEEWDRACGAAAEDARITLGTTSGLYRQADTGWKIRCAARAVEALCFPHASLAAHYAHRAALDHWPFQDPVWDEEVRRAHLRILRDLFGVPHRPPAPLDSAWLKWKQGTIRAMADLIYEQRSFEDLPILADALEEAGCTNPVLLGHGRQPGEHTRGCWLVDLMRSVN
jgi:hypothetical protein